MSTADTPYNGFVFDRWPEATTRPCRKCRKKTQCLQANSVHVVGRTL